MLILAPTRELAVQIEDDVQGFTYHTDITSIAVYGGVDMGPQERALKSGVDIVVATPGRLMDHMRSKTVDFDKLDTLVLDEADRMMDMGFWPDVRRIVADAAGSAARQTLLFSATMPEEVMKLADEVVREPKYVQVGSAGGPAKSITHTIENVPAAEKTEWLAKFLRRTDGPVLVFVRTKSGAERLARKLPRSASRPRRCTPIARSSSGRRRSKGSGAASYRVLVATDVAARGLDIDGITHVVNYEVPSSRETYVHRVGRTGRADATGTALTLVAPGRTARAAGAAAIVRARIAGMMDDTNPFAPGVPAATSRRTRRRRRRRRPGAAPGRRRPRRRRRSRSSSRAAGARRRTSASSAPTATCCRLPARKASSRIVVPGVRVLQAAPHAEEARTRGLHVLTVTWAEPRSQPRSFREFLRQLHPLPFGRELLVGLPVRLRLR